MTEKEKVKYWLDIAENDFAVAGDLMKTGRWLYVAFMCHQSIEKTLKAYWCKTQPEDPPYTHNLVLLSDKSGLADLLSEEQNEFIAALMPFNIEARYPSYKNQMGKNLSEGDCKTIMEKTNEILTWIKSKL